MPLFDLSARHGAIFEKFYGTVIFMALCTTAISNGFGILNKLKLKKRRDKILASAILCLSAMPFARLGFSSLVGNLYFVFGIVGIFWFIMLTYKYGFGK